MGVYGLPWTPAVKTWQFGLTQDHLDPEDTEGCGGHFAFFVPNPYNMGVYGLAWTPAMISEVIRTLEAKFWAQGPFGP